MRQADRAQSNGMTEKDISSQSLRKGEGKKKNGEEPRIQKILKKKGLGKEG